MISQNLKLFLKISGFFSVKYVASNTRELHLPKEKNPTQTWAGANVKQFCVVNFQVIKFIFQTLLLWRGDLRHLLFGNQTIILDCVVNLKTFQNTMPS